MAYAAIVERMTAAEFLEWEAQQETKHEFIDGEIFTMAGMTRQHVTVTLNLSSVLR